MFRPQYPFAHDVFHSGVIFFHAMNLLIFTDSFANYDPKSGGGSEGFALEIVG